MSEAKVNSARSGNVAGLRGAAAYAGQWIAFQRDLERIPGVVAAIRRGDETLLSAGYGFANEARGVPMTPQHIFRIASHSKTFTATAIMRLVEQGKLRLDDPLGAHLPWLGGRPASATVRQALNHVTGIVRDGEDCDYWQLEKPYPDPAELRRLVAEGGDVLPPNEIFKYSNIAYSLLGLVIEAVAGRPYNAHVKADIVDRLGLTDTGPDTDVEVRRRLATGHSKPMAGLPSVPLDDPETGAMSAATGFYSTAADLCRYAQAHCFGNEEMLSDASKREMQQPYWTVEQEGSHYGLGLGIADIGDRRVVGHGGGFPGHATRTWIDPLDRLVVVVLTNQTGAPAKRLADSAIKILDFGLSRPEVTEEARARAERFTGRFVNDWGVLDVVSFGGTLVGLDPEADDPVKQVMELEIVDDATLRIAADQGYGSPGELMCFDRTDDGTIARVVSGGSSHYPPEAYRRRRQRQQPEPAATSQL